MNDLWVNFEMFEVIEVLPSQTFVKSVDINKIMFGPHKYYLMKHLFNLSYGMYDNRKLKTAIIKGRKCIYLIIILYIDMRVLLFKEQTFIEIQIFMFLSTTVIKAKTRH